MSDLDEYHRLVAYWRANGLSESAAHAKAEEILESQPSEEAVRAN